MIDGTLNAESALGQNVPLSDGLDDEQFKEAFAMIAAMDEHRAFRLLTGMFVGFLEYMAVENGCDKNKEIRIEGNGGRDITIHARVA